MFEGLNVEAAKVTGNPAISAFATILEFPMIKSVLNVIAGKNNHGASSAVLSILKGLFYSVLLYKFLGAEDVFIYGYPIRNITPDPAVLKYTPVWDCEASIFKFSIGSGTKAGIANRKLVEALLKWVTIGGADIKPIWQKGTDPTYVKLQADIADAIQNIKNSAQKVDNTSVGPDGKKILTDCTSKGYNIIPGTRALCDTANTVQSLMYRLEHISKATGNMFEAMALLVEHPLAIPESFFKSLFLFLRDELKWMAGLLVSGMERFMGAIHHSYSFCPHILNQLQTTRSPLYGFPDLNRPTQGLCALKCSIDITLKPVVPSVDRTAKIIKVPTTFKLLDPFARKKDQATSSTFLFVLILILCIIVVAIAAFFTIKNF